MKNASDLPKNWCTYNLPDLLFFQEGPGVRNWQFTEQGVKLLNVRNINFGKINLDATTVHISKEEAYGKYSHFLADAGDLVIASSGIVVDNFHNKIAFISAEHLPLCMNTSTIRFKVINQELLSIDFFRIFLGTNKFKSQLKKLITGSAQLNFGPSHLRKIQIPLPPLDDQIRIAHLLGKVEGLIAQRKQHLQQLDDLLKSVFLEMFGDPVRNEKGWPINPLTIYMSEQPNNGLYKPQSSYGSGAKIIRIDSFYDGFVQNIDGLKQVEITELELLKFEIKSFDILVNRVNSIEYLGKIGVVPIISEPMVYESNMMRFRLNHDAMLPVFLMYFWRTPYLKSQIYSKAKKAVNQASINQQDVLGLLVPGPPIELQNQFATIVGKVESLKFHYKQSLTDLEALYGVLSQKAFKGELDLSRVPLV